MHDLISVLLLSSTDAHKTSLSQSQSYHQFHSSHRQKPIDEHQEGKTDEFSRRDHPLLLSCDGQVLGDRVSCRGRVSLSPAFPNLSNHLHYTAV